MLLFPRTSDFDQARRQLRDLASASITAVHNKVRIRYSVLEPTRRLGNQR